MALALAGPGLAAPVPSNPPREIAPGYSTRQVVQGEPVDLAGKRVIFTNWRYVLPGDNFDWIDDQGKSVYVHGDVAPNQARYVPNNVPWGIHLVTRKPQVMGPLSLPHRMILQQGKRYLGWSNNEYYESADGLKWEKKTQLVFNGPIADGMGQIFIDPAAPPAERFKGIFGDDQIDQKTLDAYLKAHPDDWNPRAFFGFAKTQKVHGLRGAVSPDGITWTALPDPLVLDYNDTLNTAYYDVILSRYVLFTRYWAINAYTRQQPVNIDSGWTGQGRRSIGRTESPDFRHFPPAEMILEPGNEMAPSEELYTTCHTTMPGAPDQHLLFPAVWDVAHDDTSIWMATSQEGKVWHWAPGGPILKTGLFGEWNGGCIWATPELIELPNGDWALPYSAHNVPHKYPRGQRQGANGYAVWPKGRMMGIEAPSKGGFSVLAIMAPGRKLKLNAVTQRVGGVRVEVMGINGRKFADCDPLVGDLPWQLVTWKGQSDMGVKAGNAVRLRFELDSATIYGIQFD